jgi:3-methyladenine DNA glycosylase AlkC
MRALSDGREESITLPEWLAIDMRTLLRSAIANVDMAEVAERLEAAYEKLVGEGVTVRLKGVGVALFDALQGHQRRDQIFEGLVGHTSDMVRAWAAFMLTADAGLSLHERLEASRRFAADNSVAVRECAWDSFRPYVAADLEPGLQALGSWVRDPDPNIRRCAVEATRPRGVWTPHIEALKDDPEPGLPLLEPVRSDSSGYVQRSVANWLNDASKSRPDWVRDVCARWTTESPTKETAWTVNHALRTLRKQAKT